MEWSGVRGERKRVLMDLDVMTQQHSPFIVQCYGFIIEEVSVGVVHAQVVGCGCEVRTNVMCALTPSPVGIP